MATKQIPAMHPDFPSWHHVIGIGDEEALRQKRWAGVSAVADGADSNDIEALIRLAFKSRQPAATPQVQKIREAFKTADTTFDMEGNDRELQVMAAAALVALMDIGSDWGAEAALGINTADLNGARRPDLPMDLRVLAENAIDQIAETKRIRPSLEAALPKAVLKFDFEKAAAKVREQQNFEGVEEGFNLAAETVHQAFVEMGRRQDNAVQALESFIRLQDEELQMLWWLNGQRSEDFDCAFSAVAADAKALVFAKELADHTGSLPGPASVKGLLSRAGLKVRKKIVISTAINAANSEWLQTLVPEGEPSPVSTPIHYGIKRQLEIGPGEAWIAGWASAIDVPDKLAVSPLGLGVLFYRERLLLLFGDE